MIGDPSAVPALIEAMQDGAVRVRAIMALGMIADPRSVEPLIRVLEGVGINLKGTPMPGCIVSEEWFIREQAALALGHINDLRSVPALCQALKDTRLREKASQALIELGPQVIDLLVDFINDPEASKVEQLSENVMSFATNRLDAAASYGPWCWTFSCSSAGRRLRKARRVCPARQPRRGPRADGRAWPSETRQRTWSRSSSTMKIGSG